MAVITRRLPTSNPSRKLAIGKAELKLGSPGPAGVAITPATAARLLALFTNYENAWNLIAQREAEQLVAVAAKNTGVQTLRLLAKHFVGVFNYGVERGKYLAEHRPFYHIDANNSNLPELTLEAEVFTVASHIVEGDPLRIAAGGVAMANPTMAEVDTAHDAGLLLFSAASNAKDAFDMALESIDTLNIEADKVIKKVWDEVETYFNEESVESMRANAREWGVVYVTVGPPAILSGLVKTAGGVPREEVTITIDETGATATTNHEGRYTIETSVIGPIHLTASFPAEDNVTIEFEIPEHEGGLELEVPDITMG